MERAGFVLAGGRSTRMGRDKAMLKLGEHTLIEQIARVVAQTTNCVAIVGAPERYHALGFPVYADRQPGCGPLSGLETALSLGIAEWNLVVACDMPALTAGDLERLWEHVPRDGKRTACVAALGPRGPEPLCAVYHQSCLSQVQRAMAHKQFRLRDLLGRLETESVAGLTAHALWNTNTPEEWASINCGAAEPDRTV